MRKMVMAVGLMVSLAGQAQAMTSNQVLQAFEAGGDAEGMAEAYVVGIAHGVLVTCKNYDRANWGKNKKVYDSFHGWLLQVRAYDRENWENTLKDAQAAIAFTAWMELNNVLLGGICEPAVWQ